jgi:hypothetical protein
MAHCMESGAHDADADVRAVSLEVRSIVFCLQGPQCLVHFRFFQGLLDNLVQAQAHNHTVALCGLAVLP